MTLGVPRRKHFRDMIRRTGGIGIAIENNCALEFIDGRFYKVIGSKSYSRAYRVYKVAAKWWENRYVGRKNWRRSKISAVGRSDGNSQALETVPYSMVEPSCW
jgi:hypothetical protein